MYGNLQTRFAAALVALAIAVGPAAAQDVTGQEHWVEHKDGQDEVKL